VATVRDLKDQISNLEFDIKYRKGGGRNSRRGGQLMPLGGIDYLIEENLKKQEQFKADGNQFELENQQRIYRNLISERLDQERAIADQEARLATFKQELEAAEAAQAEKDRAKGQTAGSALPPENTTNQQPAAPVVAAPVAAASAAAPVVAAPVAAAPAAAPKSEANYSGDTPKTNPSNSVVGEGSSGNATTVAPKPPENKPFNKLHAYTSYTYRITLFFLTSKDYNNLSANPSKFVPKQALISSSGGYSKAQGTGDLDTVRHPDFRTDFFIDGLSIQTIVGLNAKNKATNAVDISFTITEPYGLSLLDRLLSACETSEDKNPNYATQPYLLQIDLLASPTDDMLTRFNKTDNLIDRKRIAIKITEMKIKPSASGSTYSLRAIPFNHSAFDQTTAPVPVPLNVEAKTVGDFFANNDDQSQMFAGQLKSNEERLEADIDKWIKSNPVVVNQIGRAPTAAEIAEKRKSLKDAIIYNTGSFTAAYNRYMDELATKSKITQYPPAKITFTMPKEIADSNIVDQLAQGSDTRLVSQTKGVNNTADPAYKNKLAFPIKEGISVIEVIDQVLGKSDYIKSQINTKNKLENDAEAKDEYTGGNERTEDKKSVNNLKWYKIVPTVELKNLDIIRNNYSKTVNYAILPYTAANAYHPNFPKTTGADVEKQAVREYNYLYTGKNQDILRCDIDFDTAFYTQISSYRDQVARGGTSRFSDEGNFSQTLQSPEVKSTATVVPQTTEVQGYNAKSTGMNTATNPAEKLVGDLKNSIYTKSRGDNLNIKLQIIGDPDFIKQDDIYYNPRSEEYAEIVNNRGKSPIVQNGPAAGQIIFDSEQVYVKLNFKNAVDIDDSIGIQNKQETLSNGRKTDGSFSGVYKVQTVQSDFSRGQFTQTLDIIRMPDELPKVSTASGQPVNNESSDYSGRNQSSAVKNQTNNTNSSPGLPGVINSGTRTI
jgi:hypothetical protein